LKRELIEKLGKKAFVQSIHPYKGGELDGVAVFGLDTEYVPRNDKPSELISWQLAGDSGAIFTTQPLTTKALYDEAKHLLGGLRARVYVFVVFFAIAEVQFMNLNEWEVSEFKGKYHLSQEYGDGRMMVVDLADWYQHMALKDVAPLWGLEKLEYPIGDKVEAIERGESTVHDLLQDKSFTDYATNDAIITQKIYKGIRNYFLKYDLDIVKTMTPANTSASWFRQLLSKPIEQHDTILRKMALSCCWGGRMEAIYRGTYPQVYEYDATGQHPNSAIALGCLPLEKDWLRTSALDKWLSGVSGLGKVYFKFPESEKYPCLPIMMEDALVYVSEGISYCTVSEARLAKEMGARMLLMDGYYYASGTSVLQQYLQRLQDMRNASTDPAERGYLKLLSNSVIGKLFQKKIGMDIDKVQAYALEHDIPFGVAINLKGVDFGVGNVTVGSCFYPEWYSLILGYARASIGRQARLHNAMVISSDSFVTSEQLGEEFEAEKMHYSIKAKGDLVSYRTRFYRVGDKLAHHAVHSRVAAVEVLKEFLPASAQPTMTFAYGYDRFRHLKESWKHNYVFGSRTYRPMTVGLGFDYKRQLLEPLTSTSAWTHPWKDTDTRKQQLEQIKVGIVALKKDEQGDYEEEIKEDVNDRNNEKTNV